MAINIENNNLAILKLFSAPKDDKISVLLNHQIKLELSRKGARMGLTLSEYVRFLLLQDMTQSK